MQACIVILLASVLPGGKAILCYYRSGGTYTTNGTVISCPDTAYCYSYSSYFPPSSFHAACSTSSADCSGNDCVTCRTDYCNSLTPSSISCFSYSSSLITNGSAVACATGISSCYMYSGRHMIVGGCGACVNFPQSCRVCNTSYCNYQDPTVISCYYRQKTFFPYSGEGSVVSCHRILSTCYSYSDGHATYGDCGTCDGNSAGSCLTCSSNLCNTYFPSSITCHYGSFGGGYNGVLTLCNTGITTCYQIFGMNNYQTGCGVCDSSDPSTIAGKMCNSSSCNNFVSYPPPPVSTTIPISSFPATTAMSTAASVPSSPPTPTMSTANVPSSPPTIPSSPATTTIGTKNSLPGTGGSGGPCFKFSVKCYYSFGETDYKKREKVACSSSSCFEFSFGLGATNYFYAGCGNCSALSSYVSNCRTCYHDYCNSAAALSLGWKTYACLGVCATEQVPVLTVNRQLCNVLFCANRDICTLEINPKLYLHALCQEKSNFDLHCTCSVSF